jgi:4-amino-4-deoxy-L-arabinose transferase-like glycosyltransferase
LAILGLVLAAVAFIALYHLGRTPPTANKEMRIRDVIKDMTASGDYLVPRIDGKPHLQKPPLYYWLGTAAAKTRIVPTLVAVRLPSVLCALLLLAELFWFCRVVGLPGLAIPSVLVLSCFYEFHSNAHCANFDMLLAATSFLAVICYRKHSDTTSPLWLLATSGAVTLAYLGKATPAIPLIFIPIVAMQWQSGNLKRLLRPGFLALCVVLPLAVCLAWYLWILKMVPGAWEVFRDEGLVPFGRAAKGTASHNAPPYFFFYKILKIAAPACLLLPLLIMRLVRTRCLREESSGLRWVLFGFLAVVAIISIVPQKQEAYMLPLLPYLAVLMAHAVVNFGRDRAFERTVLAVGVLGLVAFLGLAVAGFAYFKVVALSVASGVLVGLVFLAFAVAFAYFVRLRRLQAVLTAAVCGWLFFASVYYSSVNVLDNQFKSGAITKSPTYSQEHWNRLFAKYPPLAKIFRKSTQERFARDDDSGN